MFSATDAAFEGFRVVRRKPVVLLWWAGFYMLSFALIFALAAGPIIGMVNAFGDLEAMGPAATPQDFEPFMAAYMGVMPLMVPLGILLGAVTTAAVARSVVEPGKSAFGYLRIGMDEVRVAVVSLVLSILIGIASFIALMVAGGVGGALIAGDVPGAWLIAIVLGLAAAAAIIWLYVRLSLAVPITVAEKKFAFFESFKMTSGHVWGLIGMAIIAFVMTMVVSILTSIVFFPVNMGLISTVDWEALEGADVGTILQSAGPMILISIVIYAIGAALQAAVTYAPFSAAYMGLKGTATHL